MSQEKIVVSIDPDLEDIVPGYLENRRKDVVEMRKAVAAGDFDTIRVLGHRMKGSGGGYGFDGVTDIGMGLENAAKVMDGAGIERRIDELVDYLDRVEVVFEG